MQLKIPVLHQKTHQVLEESRIYHYVAATRGPGKYHVLEPALSKQNVFDRAELSASARKHFEKTVPLLGMDPSPTPASLLGCGQMVALSNGTEANLSLLLQ